MPSSSRAMIALQKLVVTTTQSLICVIVIIMIIFSRSFVHGRLAFIGRHIAALSDGLQLGEVTYKLS